MRLRQLLRYLLRLGLLTAGFALATMGLLSWQAEGFTLVSFWPFSNLLTPHPLHLLIVGIAIIPPTLWDIFLLEQARAGHSAAGHSADGHSTDGHSSAEQSITKQSNTMPLARNSDLQRERAVGSP